MEIIEVNFFGKKAKFHHVGIVVDNMYLCETNIEKKFDPIQDVYVGFENINGINIELIEPGTLNSPVSNSLKKGIKLVHLCFSVEDITLSIKECKKYGFICIKKPVIAVAFNNNLIAWVYNKNYGLFELLEEKKNE